MLHTFVTASSSRVKFVWCSTKDIIEVVKVVGAPAVSQAAYCMSKLRPLDCSSGKKSRAKMDGSCA